MDIIQANDGLGPYVEISLTNSDEKALVSPEDYVWVSQKNWQINKGYATRSRWIPGKNTSECVKLYLEVAKKSGLYNPEFLVDHKNRNKLDCRRNNLRLATKSQNAVNSSFSTGVSIYRGVTWNKANKCWFAQYTKNYKTYHVGMYSDEDLACTARDLAVLEVFGEYAWTNRPREYYEGMSYRSFVKEYKISKHSSFYTGVCYSKKADGWQANFERLGRKISCGLYESEIQSAISYDLCRIEEFGVDDKLNFPDLYVDGKYKGLDYPTFRKMFSGKRTWGKYDFYSLSSEETSGAS